MKFFTNKSIWSKIIIVLIFVLLFEFVVTKPTLGAEPQPNDTLEFGGKLLGPILSLVVTIGDAIITICQDALMGSPEALIPIDMGLTFWQVLGSAVVWIFAAAIAVAAFVFAGPFSTAFLGYLVAGIVVGTYGSSLVSNVFAADTYQRKGYFL